MSARQQTAAIGFAIVIDLAFVCWAFHYAVAKFF